MPCLPASTFGHPMPPEPACIGCEHPAETAGPLANGRCEQCRQEGIEPELVFFEIVVYWQQEPGEHVMVWRGPRGERPDTIKADHIIDEFHIYGCTVEAP